MQVRLGNFNSVTSESESLRPGNAHDYVDESSLKLPIVSTGLRDRQARLIESGQDRG